MLAALDFETRQDCENVSCDELLYTERISIGMRLTRSTGVVYQPFLLSDSLEVPLAKA